MPAESHKLLNEIVIGWVQGWAISRNTVAPVSVDGGYRIDVGLPGHTVRYVMPYFDPVRVDRFARTLNEPGVWLKICAPVSSVAPILQSHWVLHAPEYLMTAPLVSSETTVPASYNLQVDITGQVIEAKLYAAAGELAASGRAALAGDYAVIDQVVTDVAHRRRGLGSVIMSILSDQAVLRQAKIGILVATEDGLALYSNLGWKVESQVSAAVTIG